MACPLTITGLCCETLQLILCNFCGDISSDNNGPWLRNFVVNFVKLAVMSLMQSILPCLVTVFLQPFRQSTHLPIIHSLFSSFSSSFVCSFLSSFIRSFIYSFIHSLSTGMTLVAFDFIHFFFFRLIDYISINYRDYKLNCLKVSW